MQPAEAQTFSYLKWESQTNSPFYVNSTAISADGQRVVAGTFYHVYTNLMAEPAPALESNQFGTYCYDGDGTPLWADMFEGYEGVYSVGISGEGNVAASGGWFSNTPALQGFVRAYDVESGPDNILDYRLGERVNALALSSDGAFLIAAADDVYLFQQSGGVFSDTPAKLVLASPPAGSTIPNSAQAVAITSDGAWILAGDYYGNLYLVENDNGSFGTQYVWSDTTALTTIHAIAMTPDGQWFAVAGGGPTSTVYLFSQTSMTLAAPTYAGMYTLDTGGRVGWVAITDDGTMLSAIGNKAKAGSVVTIKNDAGTLSKIWEQPTQHNPNSTSMDASGKYVSVADGYPDGNPGSFSLYDGATGDQMWSYPTPNMNWPMFVSADGSGIAAGTDGGAVYYFTPQTTTEIE